MAENLDKLHSAIRAPPSGSRNWRRDHDKMANLLRDHSATLRPELAAMLDVRVLVRTTYALEGDRLEILLVPRRVEELRALGRALAANQDGVLPNVDAVLRAKL